MISSRRFWFLIQINNLLETPQPRPRLVEALRLQTSLPSFTQFRGEIIGGFEI